MIKKIFLFIFLLSIVDVVNAQLKSEVSECFELTSIVFRLAEAPEYMNNDLSDYANDIDNYFYKYKSDKLITFVKNLRKEYGVSYDAVMIAASYLVIKNGRITILPGILKINEVDNRWTQSDFETFVIYLNHFYKETKFRTFYLRHTELYNFAVERMDELLKNIDVDWFQSFLGSEFRLPSVIISLSNGTHNYGFTRVLGKLRRNGIVLGTGEGVDGLPVYKKNKTSIVVHEFLHDYANSLILDYWDQLADAAQKIYSFVENNMEQSAYNNPQTMLFEWLTRLLTLMYIQNDPLTKFTIDYQVREDHNRGFIWMERSVIFMEHYCKNRNLFIQFQDYMPQIVNFLNYTAKNFEQVLNEFNNIHPYIVDVFPMSGSDVKSDIDVIEIRFSEPMLDAHGMKPLENENIMLFPIIGMPFWKDEYTFVIPLNVNELKAGNVYGFQLNPKFFQSNKTYQMKNIYTYTLNICK